eukprot:TRINITY_DN7298_c0_g1_i2.p1 TRINITY_DN7298_c0_g1~~TRINITY_DN7298_c0_g1_i2.p1  ORF type:complete len:458 (-),score=46.20 TRINITY_DN7298_c0_g1_i2:399-1772(-)
MAGTELTCPVCLELFNAPVTLFCSHSLCTDCIRQSAKASTLRCPTCGEVGPIPPVASLQVNTVMQHHVDVLCGRVLPQEDSALCDRCESQQAEVACDQCDMYLCNPCNQAHHVGRVLKGHQVTSAHTAWWKQIPFCTRPDHERCRTDLLLVDNHQLVCRLCLQTDDRYLGRKCIKLAIVVDDLKQDIVRWIEQTEACKLELKRVAQFVDRACVDVSKHTAEEIGKLRGLMQQLRAELDRQEQHLVAVATAAKDNEVKGLSAVRWEAFERAASLNTEIAKAQKILTTGKYTDLVAFAEGKPNATTIALLPQPTVTKPVLRWNQEAIHLENIASFAGSSESNPVVPPIRAPTPASTARGSPRPPVQDRRAVATRSGLGPAVSNGYNPDVVRMKPHPLPGVSISYKDESCIVTIADETGQHTVLSEEGWIKGRQYFEVQIVKISDGSWIGIVCLICAHHY